MANTSDQEPPSLESLARRYLDLWQDQWSALAVDPEVAENFARLFQILGQGAAAMAPFSAFAARGSSQHQQFHDPFAPFTAGRPMADTPTGTASARAPHGGDPDHAAELARRIAVLEERIDSLEGGLRDRAADLRAELAGVDPEAFARAVDREMRWRFDALLTGVERYRNHAYRRDLADPPAVWREGPARLLDYGAGDGPGGGGLPVLFVPSLINRHYILDLSGDCSLMRWLAVRGIRPLLLDWGRPGPAERRFTLTDFVAGRLERALNAVLDLFPARPAVVGYCMGGLLATALAQRRPRDVAGLALLATPWDFHGDNPAMAKRTAAALAPYEPVLDTWGELPVDAIQALFAMQDPLQVARKFTRFARMPPDGAAARGFVALEDWLNDGVALPAAVARDCLTGWYGRNDTAEGRWSIAGESVDPRRLRPPALVMIPEKDRIVPPCSARALAQAIPGADIHNPHLGHVGMIVSAGAQTLVWEPLAEWLRNRR